MEEQLKMYDEIFRVVGESLEEKLTKLNYENYEKLDSTDLGKEKKKKFNEKIEEYFSMYRDTTRRDSTEPGYVAFKEKLSYLNKKLKDEGKDQIENAEDFFNFKKKLEEEKEKHDTPNDESKSDDAPKHVDTEPSKKMPDKKGKVNSWWTENVKPAVKYLMKGVGIAAGAVTGVALFVAANNVPVLLLGFGALEGTLLAVRELPTLAKIVAFLPRKGIDYLKSLRKKNKEDKKGKKKKKKRKKEKDSSKSRELSEDLAKALSEGIMHDDEKTKDMTDALDDMLAAAKGDDDTAAALDDMSTVKKTDALDDMSTDKKTEEDKVDDMSTEDKSKSDVTPDLPASDVNIKEQREQKIQRLKNTKQRLYEAKERLRKQKEEQAKQENGDQDKSDVVTHFSNSRNYDGNYDETEIEKQALIERKNQLEKFIMSKKSPAMQTAVIDDVRTQSRVQELPSQNDDVEKVMQQRNIESIQQLGIQEEKLNLEMSELSRLLDKFKYVPEAEKIKNKEYIELLREKEEREKLKEKIIQQRKIESILQGTNEEKINSEISELSRLLDKFNWVPEAERIKNKEYIELLREKEEREKIREIIMQYRNVESVQQLENQEEFSRKM